MMMVSVMTAAAAVAVLMPILVAVVMVMTPILDECKHVVIKRRRAVRRLVINPNEGLRSRITRMRMNIVYSLTCRMSQKCNRPPRMRAQSRQ